MKTNNFIYISLSAVAASLAACSAMLVSGLNAPVWAMFIGLVAYFTGKHSFTGALSTYACLLLGLVLANFAAMAIASLVPNIGFLAFGPVVFVVAMLVVSMRGAPWLNNVPVYFLGLISFFAAHVAPGIASTLPLSAVILAGVVTAYLTHKVQAKLLQQYRQTI